MDQTAAPPRPFVALLLAELKPQRLTTIVDVGANPVNVPPYAGLLAMGGCRVVGFEPQRDAFDALQQSKSQNETYFPFAVGNGGTLDLRIYQSSGLTSVFDPYKPNLAALGRRGWGRIKERVSLDAVALDDILDLPEFDLMKIDIQGAETLVFQGASRVMAHCTVVIVELRYLRIYQNEPMMGEVDSLLRAQGFGLHKFMFNKSKMLAHSQTERLRPKLAADQLIDGDGVYVRGIGAPQTLSVDQLKHVAILAASVFDSHSLALYCLDELVRRGEAAADLPGRYVDQLPARLRAE